MKRILILVFAIATAVCVIASMPFTAGRADDEPSPIFGVKIPAQYRQWEMVGVSHEAGNLDELPGILGNALAIKAFRDGTLPFPDGATIAKLAWKHVPSVGDDAALGSMQAFVPGTATTVQIMVKDSKKYAATGGWGFGRFIGGKPVDEAQHAKCFPCHQANAKGHDFVFTRYAP
ncbi:MAG: cytochrome P460 family protein [Candidatus Acidiferrales bacterium]